MFTLSAEHYELDKPHDKPALTVNALEGKCRTREDEVKFVGITLNDRSEELEAKFENLVAKCSS